MWIVTSYRSTFFKDKIENLAKILNNQFREKEPQVTRKQKYKLVALANSSVIARFCTYLTLQRSDSSPRCMPWGNACLGALGQWSYSGCRSRVR